jgi:hypothetical protein
MSRLFYLILLSAAALLIISKPVHAQPVEGDESKFDLKLSSKVARLTADDFKDKTASGKWYGLVVV